jgi:hypothetical protein
VSSGRAWGEGGFGFQSPGFSFFQARFPYLIALGLPHPKSSASKAESRLVMATISLDPSLCSGKDSLRTPSRSREPCRAAQSAARLSRSLTWQGGGPKSSVDDLCTGRGVVLGRAATTLRSIETQAPGTMDVRNRKATGCKSRSCIRKCSRPNTDRCTYFKPVMRGTRHRE